MKEVAKLLGVELGEEFNILGSYYNPHVITEEGVFNRDGDFCISYLTRMLTGKFKIEKLPFKPKNGEEYWFYSAIHKGTAYTTWGSYTTDYLYYKVCNCFRTKEEAETKGKEIMETIMKEFEDV